MFYLVLIEKNWIGLIEVYLLLCLTYRIHKILEVLLNTGFAFNQISMSNLCFAYMFLHLTPRKLILNDFLAPEQSFDRGAENQVTGPQARLYKGTSCMLHEILLG